MAGVFYELTETGLEEVIAGIQAVASPVTRMEIADSVGALLESSTKRRIADEKRAPDGTPWAPWSEAYGATRRPGKSILWAEGDLLDSIQAVTGLTEIRVGSNLVYAAIHQFGGADVGTPGLPARPYLGLSDEDAREIRETVADVFGRALQ